MIDFFKKHVLPLGQETIRQWNEDKVSVLGTSMAYYSLFSLFPLLLIILSIVGFVLGSEDSVVRQSLSVVGGEEVSEATGEIAADEQIFEFIRTSVSPDVADQIEETLQNLNENGAGAGLIGFVTLMLSASRVFAALDQAFQIIWGLQDKEPAKPGIVGKVMTAVRKKLLAFALVLGCALLLMIALLASVAINVVRDFVPDLPGSDLVWQAAYPAVLLALLILVFTLLFKFLPDTQVKWGDVWIAGVFTAIVFAILVNVSSLYISQSNVQSYGVVGSIMALLLWIFLSSQVLFLGAELSQVYATMYGSHRSKPEKRTPRQIDAAGHPQLTAQIVEGAEPPADSPETPSATAAELRPAQGSDASEPQRLAIAAGAGVLAGALMTVAMALGGLVAAVLRMMRMVRRQA